VLTRLNYRLQFLMPAQVAIKAHYDMLLYLFYFISKANLGYGRSDTPSNYTTVAVIDAFRDGNGLSFVNVNHDACDPSHS